MKARLYWRIRGYDGSKPIFDESAEIAQFTEAQIKHLLKALVAKAGLEYAEIVGAYAKRRSGIANAHLVVQKEFGLPTYRCGSDPYFEASVVDENRKIVRRP